MVRGVPAGWGWHGCELAIDAGGRGPKGNGLGSGRRGVLRWDMSQVST